MALNGTVGACCPAIKPLIPRTRRAASHSHMTGTKIANFEYARVSIGSVFLAEDEYIRRL